MVPTSLQQAFLQNIHDAHLGIVKSRLLSHTLMYWPKWNNDIKTMCQTCETCRENKAMPANTLRFKVKANHPGEIYGVDVTNIPDKSHIVCVFHAVLLYNRYGFGVYHGVRMFFHVYFSCFQAVSKT